MRLSKSLATGAVTLSALAALTGCGGSDEQTEDSGLPKADTMAAVQQFINESGAQCNELEATGDEANYMEEEAKDPAWGIKERAVCRDGEGRDVTLLLIGDMAKFQGSLAKGGATFSIGQNFAVAAASDSAGQSLVQNGLLVLSCDQGDREDVPSGYEIHEGLVKPCFTTNYNA